MDQPTEEHHLKDLGSAEGTAPTAEDAGALDAQQTVQDASPPARTTAGALGLEDSPADNPLTDDRFLTGR